MAEITNNNVFSTQKFVDFSGLDYFWGKAKEYIDGVDGGLKGRLDAIDGEAGRLASIEEALNGLGTGAGSVQSQIQNAIEALDLANTYDSKGAAGQALVDAKKYVDDMKISDAIATAKSEAIADAATAAAIAYESRIAGLEAIDHEKLASDASAAAVATVLDGAPEKFDTLKEIAQWISDNESAESAADLVNRVKALEDVDADNRLDVLEGRDVYVAQDVTNAIATAKSEAIADAATAAAIAYESRIATLEGQDVYVEETVSASINKAKEDAIAAVNETLKGYYTKDEVDGLLESNSTADQAYAKEFATGYTDALFNSIVFASEDDINGLFA